jgi:hypothetical protein
MTTLSLIRQRQQNSVRINLHVNVTVGHAYLGRKKDVCSSAVVSGTWWGRTGTKWDSDATVQVKVGGFVTHTAKQIYYDDAKDEEVVLIIVGEGSATLTLVDEAK